MYHGRVPSLAIKRSLLHGCSYWSTSSASSSESQGHSLLLLLLVSTRYHASRRPSRLWTLRPRCRCAPSGRRVHRATRGHELPTQPSVVTCACTCSCATPSRHPHPPSVHLPIPALQLPALYTSFGSARPAIPFANRMGRSRQSWESKKYRHQHYTRRAGE